MAHAYTPGLKVTEDTTIFRRRILPLKGDVMVKEGDRVQATDTVARTFLPGKVYPVNLSNKFAVAPEDIPAIMKTSEGAEITRGDILAETPGIFGFFKSNYLSPVSGKLESISRVSGQIMLREPPTPIQVLAYIEGEIVEVIPEEGVVVKTYGALIQGIFGIGGEKEGTLRVLVSSPEAHLRADMLTEDMKGMVIVGGSGLDFETYQRASDLGIVGLVVGGYDDTLIKEILSYDIGVAITGGENLKTSLLMTEGFGRIPMAKKTFELLQKMESKRASLNGATQIRAGVMRPEIIVPLQDSTKKKGEKHEEGLMEVGDSVRIIREPYFGEIGEVAALPSEPVKIETEARVRILEVTLKSGGKVTLPRANVELIEE